MTARATKQQQGGKGAQIRYSSLSGGLGRWQRSALVLQRLICPKNYPFRGDKLSSWWSTCRIFRNWQVKRASSQKVFLAYAPSQCQVFYLRMQRVFSLQSYLLQALWGPAVLACTNSLVKRPLDKLCNRLTIVSCLEEQQLWLNSCHCRPFDQDNAIQGNESHHQCSGTSKSNNWHGNIISWLSRLHHQWLRSNFYVQVLVYTLLFFRHQEMTLHRILLSNKQADRITE